MCSMFLGGNNYSTNGRHSRNHDLITVVDDVGPCPAPGWSRPMPGPGCNVHPFCHCPGQLPVQDVAGVVVQDSQQVVPAPILHFQIGDLRLPQFVHPPGWLLILVLGRYHHENRSGYQVKCPQDAIHTQFRDETSFCIRDMPRLLPGKLLWICQGNLNGLIPNAAWYSIPELAWAGLVICQPFIALFLVLLIPALEITAREVQFLKCPGNRQVLLFHERDDLYLLRL